MTNDFRDLENLVARIQKQLAPNAEIIPDVRLLGKLTGVNRQIDVLVKEAVGQYELRIVIECKDYSRPVNVKSVEEFSGLLGDVGAHKGAMVCPKGFTKAAMKLARFHQIDLYSPVDTEPHKWQGTFKLWTVCDLRTVSMGFHSFGKEEMREPLPQEFYRLPAFDLAGQPLGTLEQEAFRLWQSGRLPLAPGVHSGVELFGGNPIIIEQDGSRTDLIVDLVLNVSSSVYLGQLSLSRLSGFHDHISGNIITNLLEPELPILYEIVRDWDLLHSEREAQGKGFLSFVIIVPPTERIQPAQYQPPVGIPRVSPSVG